jgi:tetratricopeptide (TPR) repeat protein
VAESSATGRGSRVRLWLAGLALIGCLPAAGVDGAWAQGSRNETPSPESKVSNREREIKDFERLIEQANRLVEKEKIQEAIASYEAVVQVAEKIYGLDHPITATSINNFGYLLSRQGLTARHSRCLPKPWRSDKKLSGLGILTPHPA